MHKNKINALLLISSFGILCHLFPWTLYFGPLIFVWLWLMLYFELQLKIPFSSDLFLFLPSLKAFYDSILSLRSHWALLKTAPLLIPFYYSLKLPWHFWLGILISTLLLKLALRKKLPDIYWEFPNENYRLISLKYPLLRKTTSFLGEKQLEIQAPLKPHILFIFLESFQAANIGSFSPNFNAWAEKGALFTQFHANGERTYQAMIASFFGVPAHLETMSLRPFCSIPMIGLPQILKEHGYNCAHFQGNCTSFDWSFPFLKKAGFDLIQGDEHFPNCKRTSWGIHDEELFEIAFQFLEKESKPTFLSLFTISNHHPWESPIKFSVPKHLPKNDQNFLQTFAYTDLCLGKFLDQLQKSKILEKSILFILADHGLSSTHIPLLILGAKKARIDTPASQVDLMPTVLDLLNLEAVHHGVGKSLLRKAPELKQFSLYTLFKEKRLAPASLEQCSFEQKAPAGAKDDWIQTLKKTSILDLSHSHITDQGLRMLKKSSSLHELNLSYCPFLTDDSLEWIAGHCPNLSILNLSYCPFLTEKGIALLQKLDLKMLNLEGNQNVTQIPWKRKTYLEALHLKKCPNFTGKALLRLVKFAPRLKYLTASIENLEKAQFLKWKMKELNYLLLENGEGIESSSCKAFLKKHKKLKVFILNGKALCTESLSAQTKPSSGYCPGG